MNVTYFLGAGASSNCLPTMFDFNDRLRHFRDHLQTEISRSVEYFKVHSPTEPVEDIEERWIQDAKLLKENIDKLLKEIYKHQTVDTLAKKYFIKNRPEDLFRLKTVLFTFFLYEQCSVSGIKELPDKRYDTFIASIIGKKINNIDLPSNIKFITWNYDLQFELAYQEYSSLNINQIQDRLNCIPSYWTIDKHFASKLDKFSIVRLNGVIGIPTLYPGDDFLKEAYLDNLKSAKKPFSELIKIYTEICVPIDRRKVFVNGLSFFNYDWEYQQAFEENLYPNYDQRKEIAMEILKSTEILVIIGYSFPIFNRETDSLLLKQLYPGKCKKVYIQDRVPDKILSRIKGFIPKEFIDLTFGDHRDEPYPFRLVSDLEQFFLPDEL